MPAGNGTGPLGQGPMTGWGMGTCKPSDSENSQQNIPPFAGMRLGRGMGRGMGRGIGRGMGRGMRRGMGQGFAMRSWTVSEEKQD